MRQGEWKVDGPSIRVYAAGGFTEDDVLARRRAQRRRHQARVVYAFQHRRRKHARRELKAELAAPMDLTLERVPHRIGIGREPGARLVAEDELLRGESGPARIAELSVAGEDDARVRRKSGTRVGVELTDGESGAVARGLFPCLRQR